MLPNEQVALDIYELKRRVERIETFEFPAGAEWTDFVPSSLTLNAGTNTGGNVASVQVMFDADTYDIDEVAAAPGFDVEFNFTLVDRFPKFVVARWNYNGSSMHYVGIDIWNFNTLAWDMLHTFSTSGGFFRSAAKYIPVVNQVDYVDAGQNAMVRFDHVTGGNNSHDIQIDYVALVSALV